MTQSWMATARGGDGAPPSDRGAPFFGFAMTKDARAVTQLLANPSLCRQCLMAKGRLAGFQVDDAIRDLGVGETLRLSTGVACDACRNPDTIVFQLAQRRIPTFPAMADPRCAYCEKPIAETEDKATIQGRPFHSRCWERKMAKR